ncbi:hypothetical protein V1477_001467 [Vespula maculifrons]|uniref:Uncharacterized protein n=1 Tax=Vespula maculifrons TaxID=7453 RepID=A0ABD2D085_VESMC
MIRIICFHRILISFARNLFLDKEELIWFCLIFDKLNILIILVIIIIFQFNVSDIIGSTIELFSYS